MTIEVPIRFDMNGDNCVNFKFLDKYVAEDNGDMKLIREERKLILMDPGHHEESKERLIATNEVLANLGRSDTRKSR